MNQPHTDIETTDDADAQALAERLREARDYVGLSQELVAEHLGVPRPAVSSMERGTRKVSSLELKRLAALYRRPVTFLLGTDAEPDVTMSPDSFVGALFRATQELDESDRDQVLRFAEFLRQGPPPRDEAEA